MTRNRIFVLMVAILMLASALTAGTGGDLGPRGSVVNTDSEPNDTIADATNVTAETITIPGTVESGDWTDYYKIWLNNTGGTAETVTFNCDFNRSDGVSIEVLDQAGILYYIGYDANADAKNVRLISGYSQFYYINVSTQEVDATYDLSVTKISGAYSGNNNNHPSQAQTVPGDNAPITKNIDGDVPSDPQDFYKISMVMGGTASDLLIIYMTQPAMADYRLELYRSDGPNHYERIKFSTPKPGQDVVMSFGADQTGDVYIRVLAVSGNGAYTVYIQKTTINKDANNGWEFAEPITLTNDHTWQGNGELGETIDVEDWFSLPVVEGQFINISISSDDYDATTDLPVISMLLLRADHVQAYEDDSDSILDPTGFTNGTVTDTSGNNYIKMFIIAGGGTYTLDLLTDKPPVVNAGITPSIFVMESTTNSTLDLDTVFSDPDASDTLSYTYEKIEGGTDGYDDDTNLSISIAGNGVVTVTPKAGIPRGWTGSGPVKFTARDPYGLEASVEFGIVVKGINHEPYVKAPYNLKNAFPDPVLLTYGDMESNSTLDLKDVFADNDTGDKHRYYIYADNELWIERVESEVLGQKVLQAANINDSVRISFNFENNLVDHKGPITIRILDDAKVAKKDHDIQVYFVAIDDGEPEMNSSLVKLQIMVRTPGGKEPKWDSTFTKVEFDEDNSTTVDFDEYITDLDPADKEKHEYEVTGLGTNVTATKVDRNNYRFSAKENWNGEVAGVKVKATDTFGLTANATIKVVVQAVPDPPVEVKGKTSPDPGIKVTVDENALQNFTVGAIDPDAGMFTVLMYKWYLDSELQTSVLNNSFSYRPSFDASGEHTIMVEVLDDEVASFGFNVTWTIEVLNVNRAPTGVKIAFPEHNRTYKQGAKIEFKAQTASDPDGDPLGYVWYADDKELPGGDNQTFIYKKLKPGKHVIKLEVNDGNGGLVTDEVEIKIKKEEKNPGFEPILMLAALVIVGLIGLRNRKRSC